MTTTARQLARPYQANVQQNTRSVRISRRTAVEWACILVGGAIVSELLLIAIDAASAMLAKG